MDIENKIFSRYTPDFEKLKNYGFEVLENNFVLKKKFMDDMLEATITISSLGEISGTVFDIENEDEYLPLRISDNQGSFVNQVRTAYKELLENIRQNCFNKNYYIFPQSNRIANLVIEKYGNEPEFLWEKFPGIGIFRNPKTDKWYLAIMNLDRSKVQPNKTGLVEIADLKLSPEHVEKIIKQEPFYPAYHMNKKHWITIVLDDSVTDDKILELIEISHKFSEK